MRISSAAYLIWQATWGFPQTLAGACTFLSHVREPHFLHHGALVTVWRSRFGLSLGPFVFLNAKPGNADGAATEDAASPLFVEYVPGMLVNDRLLVHEYGHTIQSLILGPLYLPIVGVPSVIWLKTPRLSRRRHDAQSSYYAFYTERWANRLGERFLKRPSMGMALID